MADRAAHCSVAPPGSRRNVYSLPRDGDVVVVTINPRLNVFGYLYR